jgi:hypothetical protein
MGDHISPLVRLAVYLSRDIPHFDPMYRYRCLWIIWVGEFIPSHQGRAAILLIDDARPTLGEGNNAISEIKNEVGI